MNFVVYDLIFLALFSIFVVWFLWRNKKRVEREGILYLYRTQVGVKILNYIGKKYKRTLDFLSYLIVIVGYALMIFFTYYMVKVVYYYFIYPQFTELFDGPPLMLLIPYFPQIFGVSEFFPAFYFTYFLVAIAIVAIVHEGAHGIFMRRYGIGVKSTGFGFLGPILAFFVEQDEKDMPKKPIFQQLTVLAAGVFANLIIGIVFLGLLIFFFSSFYTPYGVTIVGYSASNILTTNINELTISDEMIQINGEDLVRVDINGKSYFAPESILELDPEEIKNTKAVMTLYQNQPAIHVGLKGTIIKINGVETRSLEALQGEFSKFKVGDEIQIQTDYNGEIDNYDITLGESYEEAGKPVVGIGIGSENPLRVFAIIDNLFKEPGIDYRADSNPELMDFIFLLLEWVILINILVALFNMLPLGIFDGGRFFYLTILAITKNEKFANKAFRFMTIALLLMVTSLMVIWVLRRFVFPLF
ncbi:MAG: site-2 protease family protein [archaeon]